MSTLFRSITAVTILSLFSLPSIGVDTPIKKQARSEV